MALRIGILVHESAMPSTVTAPLDTLRTANKLAHVLNPGAPPPLSARLVAARAGTVRLAQGVSFEAELARPDELDVLLVSAIDYNNVGDLCRRLDNLVAERVLLRRCAEAGLRIATTCNAMLLLAEAGLLDGRRATTHWQRTRHFVKTYPQVRLEPDRIFVRDGDVWTSAGITAGIDLSLAMIAEDYGDEIAQNTAKQLVLYHRRSGGQSQFSSLLELKAPNGRFGPLLAWARENLDAPLTVEDLAEQAGMSSRHFTRAFMAETGTTPSKAVERLRIEVARQRVQSSSEAIERVAQATGFRDPERMRRAFIRAFGQPPQSLRRAARAG